MIQAHWRRNYSSEEKPQQTREQHFRRGRLPQIPLRWEGGEHTFSKLEAEGTYRLAQDWVLGAVDAACKHREGQSRVEAEIQEHVPPFPADPDGAAGNGGISGQVRTRANAEPCPCPAHAPPIPCLGPAHTLTHHTTPIQAMPFPDLRPYLDQTPAHTLSRPSLRSPPTPVPCSGPAHSQLHPVQATPILPPPPACTLSMPPTHTLHAPPRPCPGPAHA